MACHLLSLPTEILLYTLSELPYTDLYRCQAVCKSLRSLIKNSSELQYSVGLQKASYDDVPSSVGLPTKLANLKSAHESWQHQRVCFTKRVDVKHFPSGIYDLAGGVYLLGEGARRTLYYIQLPDTEEDTPEWKGITMTESIIDMGLAVDEHDLIAVITTSPIVDTDPETFEIALHLLQLSTGEPHPEAKNHRILVHKSPFDRPAIGIEIVGGNLILILSYFRHRIDDRLFVYEWKTGKLKMTNVAPPKSYSGPLFLTEHTFLLPNAKKGVLEVWDIPRVAGEPSPSAPRCNLALPTLAPGRVFLSIASRGEPNPTGDSSPPGSVFRRRSYQANAENAIMIFNVTVEPVQHNPFNLPMAHSYAFFVHRKSILKIIEDIHNGGESYSLSDEANATNSSLPPTRLPVGSPPIDIHFPTSGTSADTKTQGTGNLVVPWTEWGPSCTRWLEGDRFSSRWITTSAGQRAVLSDNHGGGTRVLVLDFNEWNIKKTAWELTQKKNQREEDANKEQSKDKGKSVDPEEHGRRDSSSTLATPTSSSVQPQLEEMQGDGEAVPNIHDAPMSGIRTSLSSGESNTRASTLGSAHESVEALASHAGPSPDSPGFVHFEVDFNNGHDNAMEWQEIEDDDGGEEWEDMDEDADDEMEVGFGDEAEEEDQEDGEEEDNDAAPFTMLDLQNLPPGLMTILFGPNGAVLTQHIQNLQQAAAPAGNNGGGGAGTGAGQLGHLGAVVGPPTTSMPGGWDEPDGETEIPEQIDEDEGDGNEQHRVRTSVIFQTTHVDKIGRSFESPIESRLPFVQYLTFHQPVYDGVLMDEERLLGIVTNQADTIRRVDIQYFG